MKAATKVAPKRNIIKTTKQMTIATATEGYRVLTAVVTMVAIMQR